jgi:coenzyme Q-binding protein COQ10
MPSFQTTRLVKHSADRMFDLVADVERFSEFVPLCERHVIRARRTEGQNEILISDMTVAYRMFRETFRSRSTLDRAHGLILVDSHDGPLKSLFTQWSFQPQDAASCRVGFKLAYELASRTLSLLVGPVLDASFHTFVRAFARRADAIYGRPGSAPMGAVKPGPAH